MRPNRGFLGSDSSALPAQDAQVSKCLQCSRRRRRRRRIRLDPCACSPIEAKAMDTLSCTLTDIKANSNSLVK